MAAEPSVAHFVSLKVLGFVVGDDALIITDSYETNWFGKSRKYWYLSPRTLKEDVQNSGMDYKKILEAVENHFKEL